jgi:hypothetical protein
MNENAVRLFSIWYQPYTILSSAMASTPCSSIADSQNPFANSSPPTAAASAIQHVNIRTHMSMTLDYCDTNFSAWSAFFNATFRKFGIIDHVDGSVDAQSMCHTRFLRLKSDAHRMYAQDQVVIHTVRM